MQETDKKTTLTRASTMPVTNTRPILEKSVNHPERGALFYTNPDSHLESEELTDSQQQVSPTRGRTRSFGSRRSPRRSRRPPSVSSAENLSESNDSRIDVAYQPKILKNECPTSLPTHCNVNEAKILVIYTGGTIGMTCKNGVYSPEPDFIVRKLRNMPMLNDRDYSTQFISQTASTGDASNELNDPREDDDEEYLPLALPESRLGKRIVYVIYEYEPLLDSSNMTMDDWVRIAADIELSYEGFDGFVILHGTDTMAYTAAALSFMLENLGKPVILTGSQIPICEMRSDGRDNLLGALYMAGHYCIPEVCLYFNSKLMRGNRTSKVSTNRLDAFDTPNQLPLAVLEVDVQVNWDIVIPSLPFKFRAHKMLNRHVGILRLFPSISTELVLTYLQPPMAGVVLQTYGMGNAPDNRGDIIEAMKEATARGVIIVNISQCPRGEVASTYAVSAALVEAGVIAGVDMTPETALAKLSYVLSKEDWNQETKRRKMTESLRGEMRVAKSVPDAPLTSASGVTDLLSKLASALNFRSQEEIHRLKSSLIPSLMSQAVRSKDLETLTSLYETLGTYNIPTMDGRTLLHVSAFEGSLSMSRHLLEYGASVHVRDAFGRSPLIDAIERKRLDVVSLLRDAGAHLADAGYGATHGVQLCAAVGNKDVKLLRCWLKAGADANEADYAKSRPLHVAARLASCPEIVDVLLKSGARTNVSDGNGNTPLDLLLSIPMENREESWKLIYDLISKWDQEGVPVSNSLSLKKINEDDEDATDNQGESLADDEPEGHDPVRFWLSDNDVDSENDGASSKRRTRHDTVKSAEENDNAEKECR